jgi:acetoacetyl-CoA synthetase
VLNPSGVRFGSGEIYSVLERSEFAARIDDAICVGQRRPQDKDERVLLFIKMRPGQTLDQPFEQAIRATIKGALSARHVPAYILEVKEIPVSCDILGPFACVCDKGQGADGRDGDRADVRLLTQYTINGKKIEIAVKKIVSGLRVVPSSTVANPDSLEDYCKYQEIERFTRTSEPAKDMKL